MKGKKKKADMRTFKTLFIITLCVVAVIWGHSMMPGEISLKESGFFKELLISLGFSEALADEFSIRKLAHFIEYMVLGILITLDFYTLTQKTVRFLLPIVSISHFVALVDETIQLFVTGRSGSLLDVWLDLSGSLAGIAFIMAVIYFVGEYKKDRV